MFCDANCAICLEVCKDDEQAMITTCKHPFHFHCIQKWSTVKCVCPLCKGSYKSFIYRGKKFAVSNRRNGASDGNNDRGTGGGDGEEEDHESSDEDDEDMLRCVICVTAFDLNRLNDVVSCANNCGETAHMGCIADRNLVNSLGDWHCWACLDLARRRRQERMARSYQSLRARFGGSSSGARVRLGGGSGSGFRAPPGTSNYVYSSSGSNMGGSSRGGSTSSAYVHDLYCHAALVHDRIRAATESDNDMFPHLAPDPDEARENDDAGDDSELDSDSESCFSVSGLDSTHRSARLADSLSLDTDQNGDRDDAAALDSSAGGTRGWSRSNSGRVLQHSFTQTTITGSSGSTNSNSSSNSNRTMTGLVLSSPAVDAAVWADYLQATNRVRNRQNQPISLGSNSTTISFSDSSNNSSSSSSSSSVHSGIFSSSPTSNSVCINGVAPLRGTNSNSSISALVGGDARKRKRMQRETTGGGFVIPVDARTVTPANCGMPRARRRVSSATNFASTTTPSDSSTVTPAINGMPRARRRVPSATNFASTTTPSDSSSVTPENCGMPRARRRVPSATNAASTTTVSKSSTVTPANSTMLFKRPCLSSAWVDDTSLGVAISRTAWPGMTEMAKTLQAAPAVPAVSAISTMTGDVFNRTDSWRAPCPTHTPTPLQQGATSATSVAVKRVSGGVGAKSKPPSSTLVLEVVEELELAAHAHTPSGTGGSSRSFEHDGGGGGVHAIGNKRMRFTRR